MTKYSIISNRQAAVALGCSEPTATAWLIEAGCKRVSVGTGKRMFWRESDVVALIEARSYERIKERAEERLKLAAEHARNGNAGHAAVLAAEAGALFGQAR